MCFLGRGLDRETKALAKVVPRLAHVLDVVHLGGPCHGVHLEQSRTKGGWSIESPLASTVNVSLPASPLLTTPPHTHTQPSTHRHNPSPVFPATKERQTAHHVGHALVVCGDKENVTAGQVAVHHLEIGLRRR